jgi:hypothetical protein
MVRQPLRGHPYHDRRGFLVGLEPAGTVAPGCVCLVRVQPGITQPVPVRRTAAEIPALLQGLRGHRDADPDPGYEARPQRAPWTRAERVPHRGPPGVARRGDTGALLVKRYFST